MVVYDSIAEPDAVPDFDQVWFAATALLDGRNPYSLVGPGLEFNWPWPLYYPLTAPLSILPLGFLSLEVARVVFVALPATVLAFQLSRCGWDRLIFFLSGAFLSCVKTAQWGPWIACSLFLPWLGFFMVSKPNVGLGAFAGARSMRDWNTTGLTALALVGISVAVQPGWPSTWLQSVETAPHFRSLVSLPGGFLLLLAALRWRQWEARLLLMLALVPQTPGPHAALLLMLLPRTRRGLLILAILSYAPLFLTTLPSNPTFAQFTYYIGRTTLWFVFLPALALVMQQPNVGPAPAFVERLVSRFPAWVRGESGPAMDPRSLVA